MLVKLLVAGLALAGAAAGVIADPDPVANDVLALNYALQLEHLESAFYTSLLDKFPAGNEAFDTQPAGLRDYLVLIGAHEQAHVTALSSLIDAKDEGAASAACTKYSFQTDGSAPLGTDLNAALATAITLEDTGVSAYTAALNHLTDKDLQQAAATIATIEARHAAYLRSQVGDSEASPETKIPFPAGTDTPLSPDTVVAAVDGLDLIDTCVYSLATNIPAVRPGGVATNNTLANAKPSSATQSTTTPVYTPAQFQTDLDVLNYALTLEHFEAAFYNAFEGKFDAEDFAGVTGLSARGTEVLNNIVLVQAHENAHVSALTSIITARGGSPVTAGCYNFTSVTTAAEFLAAAMLLEDTGVSAYDGAANELTDTGLQQIAATVATVEARHAAYLRLLNGELATDQTYMTGNFDKPVARADIVTKVKGLPFIVDGRLNDGCVGDAKSSSGGQSSGTNTDDSTGTITPGGDPTDAASFAAPALATVVLAAAAAFAL